MSKVETVLEPQTMKKTFSNEEAFNSALNYFNGDELAARVWVNKYALKDSDGHLYELTPDDMHWRLAREIARIEQRYEQPMSEIELFELFARFKYIIPQGGPMTGIGNGFQVASLSNCFVIGNEGNSDSYGGIMKIDQEQVQLMKRRGGVGHDLSHIRPKGSPVKNSALTSTGIVP
ncbi:MAG: ribonucleoside-diphosphate reductase, adenosylcobalamin-dependent, partial [Breznakibacter sp.]|nr:ribonucleoside-diphosphate reductase, adenosylcobalamin-dependent [Breznakibacter sp.]